MIWISWIRASEAPSWKALMDQRLNIFLSAIELIAQQVNSNNNGALGQKLYAALDGTDSGATKMKRFFLIVLEDYPDKRTVRDWLPNWQDELERLEIKDHFPNKALHDWCDELERYQSFELSKQ